MTEEIPLAPPPAASFSSLSHSQLMALAILPSISAPFSVLGSSLIIYMLIHRPDDRPRTYRRLLLGVSVFDIVLSSVVMLGPLPVPQETGAFMARGNTATCSAAGFGLSIAISNLFYNASLMLFFVLKIRYKVREHDIEKRVEPFMHLVSILVPLCFGIVCLSLELYNPTSLGLLKCFISPYPLSYDFRLLQIVS